MSTRTIVLVEHFLKDAITTNEIKYVKSDLNLHGRAVDNSCFRNSYLLSSFAWHVTKK